MKEIKFRIFDKQEEEFLNEEDYAINFVGTIFKACLDEEVFEVLDADMYIVTQYTGLKDKNGVEIYEGDIVNFQHIDDYGYMTNVFQNGFYRGVVKWGEHYPAFDIFDIKDNSTFGFDCNIFSMESDIVIEVIGNIYENKELLNTDG